MSLHHHHQGNGFFFVHEGEGDDHLHMAYDVPIERPCDGCDMSRQFAEQVLASVGMVEGTQGETE